MQEVPGVKIVTRVLAMLGSHRPKVLLQVWALHLLFSGHRPSLCHFPPDLFSVLWRSFSGHTRLLPLLPPQDHCSRIPCLHYSLCLTLDLLLGRSSLLWSCLRRTQTQNDAALHLPDCCRLTEVRPAELCAGASLTHILMIGAPEWAPPRTPSHHFFPQPDQLPTRDVSCPVGTDTLKCLCFYLLVFTAPLVLFLPLSSECEVSFQYQLWPLCLALPASSILVFNPFKTIFC